MCLAWSSYNILEVLLVYVYRYLILSPYHTFWADRFMWVFLFEIVSLTFTCIISFREIPSESIVSKNIPFYVTSPKLLIPRRPPQPLIPLHLSSERSKGMRRLPDLPTPRLLPSVRSRIVPVRGRRKVTNRSRGSGQAGGSQQTHQRSGQHTSALPNVQ